MGIFGKIALEVIELFDSGEAKDITEAWDKVVEKEGSSTAQKGCPKGAFLGLCEEGMVKGIPPGSYTASEKNKQYAIKAVDLLRRIESEKGIPAKQVVNQISKGKFWEKIAPDKKENGQLDVVFTLVKENLIEL
ncbi:MAG: hypothetical protein J7J33_03240 [Caldisericia bacterium]|nr:hypothetical protein [Caldisericia bacterium]